MHTAQSLSILILLSSIIVPAENAFNLVICRVRCRVYVADFFFYRRNYICHCGPLYVPSPLRSACWGGSTHLAGEFPRVQLPLHLFLVAWLPGWGLSGPLLCPLYMRSSAYVSRILGFSLREPIVDTILLSQITAF